MTNSKKAIMAVAKKAIMAVATTMVSSSVFAHAGHDHTANTAMLSHVIFYGSIVAGLAIIVFAMVKYFNAK